MDIKILGIDIVKRVFQLHGEDIKGKVALKKRLPRHQLLNFISNLPPCLIGIESCSGAHYWARQFQAYGHEVRLIPPQYVKPYVKTNKNDANDAEAICEAVSRSNMRFVPVKTVAQQNIQSASLSSTSCSTKNSFVKSNKRAFKRIWNCGSSRNWIHTKNASSNFGKSGR